MQRTDNYLQDFIFILKNLNGFFSLILVLFLSMEAFSQKSIYENFGVDDGLPSSEVYDSYQDKEGYIWFATDRGLSRYNGYEFENFNTANGLAGNTVLRFYPQENGQIWCYTLHSQSLFYFDEKFDGFKQFEFNETLHKYLNNQSIVKSVQLDKQGSVHIGGHQINGEVVISKNGEVETYNTNAYYFEDTLNLKSVVLKPISDSVTTTFHFTTLDSSLLKTTRFHTRQNFTRMLVKWFVENESAIFMNDKYVKLIFKNKEDIIIKSQYSPTGIDVLDENRFFIGYQFGGGKILDKQGNIINEYLTDQSVTSFLEDHEGGYWFTTLSSGVFYIKNPTITTYNSVHHKSHEINSIVKTRDDELLIGFINGTISKMSRNGEIIVNNNPEINTPAFVEYDSQLDKTYIYSDNRLASSYKEDILYKYLLKLSEPIRKTIFASNLHGYYEITENDSCYLQLSPYRVHDVCVWNGDTLIATPVGIFNVQNNDYQSLTSKSHLFDFRSDDIDVNENTNTLYVATQGAGIIINDGNQIINLTEKDGLNSNIVNEVYIENDTTLWVCTNRGVNRIIWKKQGISISSMNKKDGLLSNEVKDIEIINDTVWVGTKQGLCSFPKNQMSPEKITVPDLMLKDVLVNNISQPTLEKTFFAYDENVIDIVLEGISYAQNDAIQYQYRLKKNQDWSTTQNRTIHFSPLSPGNYAFEARMCIDDQNCSENIVRYAFTIRAPFWQRWWFISMCLGVIALLIYTFFKIRVLTYNKDVTRELIRLIIKKLKKDDMYFTFRENGNQVRVKTEDIIYVKSAGNYIDLYTKNKTHTIRLNIGKFLDNVPDKLEYVRLHRSYIVRIDKITVKGKNEVRLINGVKVPVSMNHHRKLKEVVF